MDKRKGSFRRGSLKGAFGAKAYRDEPNKTGTTEIYEPTPEEIAAACARIQETWTELEREQRAVWHPERAVFEEMSYLDILHHDRRKGYDIPSMRGNY